MIPADRSRRWWLLVRRAVLVAAAMVLGSAYPLAAQYQAPGSGVQQPQQRKGQLQNRVEESRFRLGPFRVDPWLGVRNISYQRDLLGSERGDLTATAGAGARLYLPLGGRAVVATHVLPEYQYWHREKDRRKVMGRYGAGLFVFFNRLELEATARRLEDLDFASDEVLVRAPQSADTFELAGQLRLAGSIALFAGARETHHRFDPFDDQELANLSSALDRDHQVARAGLRYLLPATRGHFGLGVTAEETSFRDPGNARSHQGEGLYGEITLRGNRLDLFLDASRRHLEPTAGSEFPEVRLTTGQAAVQLRIGWRLAPNVYFRRSLSYPVTGEGPYVVDDRLGLRLGLRVRFIRDLRLQMFYELGEMEFADTGRVDDVTAYGISTGVPINRWLQLGVGARRTEYTSNVPGFDRRLDEIHANLNLTIGMGGFGIGQAGEW